MAGKNQSLVPFGKYRGQPVEMLLADGDYVEWIMGQPGLVQKLQREYPVLFNIITVGAPQTDDTPDHNRLQARFLDCRFQEAFFSLAHGKSIQKMTAELTAKWRSGQESALAQERQQIGADIDRCKAKITKYEQEIQQPGNEWMKRYIEDARGALKHVLTFRHNLDDLHLTDLEPPTALIFPPEFECGYDVRLQFGWQHSNITFDGYREYGDRKFHIVDEVYDTIHNYEFHVEIKPQMGDDFPGVLRQMKNNGANVLCLGAFEAEGATIEEVQAMFGKYKIVLVDVIEEIAAGLTSEWRSRGGIHYGKRN